MLSFDYTVDLQLSETLAEIDQFRSRILCLPVSTKTELRLRWETLAIRTWATLALAGHELPKHHVATILSHTARPTQSTAVIYAIRIAYEYIHTIWRASPKPFNTGGAQTLFTLLYPHPEKPFSALQEPISRLTTYLSAENAHPVIQASIAHLYILTMSRADLGLFARMTHYLILAKYGYDVRGLSAPDRQWQEDANTYTRLADNYRANGHMTTWLAFMAEHMRQNLELIARDMESSRFRIEFPPSFWALSDRQKDIVRLLEKPDMTITNRYVQKHFKVSQITASRDLTKLTTLGILYPHGKGRSVYYTKI